MKKKHCYAILCIIWMLVIFWFSAQVADDSQAVSYTHLDVYKRQRNGLFFGVMFIAMGALFAQRTLYLKNWQVLLGFLLSAGLLFAECFALKDNGFMHDLTSMYAMLLPCMFFLFLGLLRIHLPKSKVYKTCLLYTSRCV